MIANGGHMDKLPCIINGKEVNLTLAQIKSFRPTNGFTLYSFKVNGESELLSLAEASIINTDEVRLRLEEIQRNKANKRMTKDGFTPGWQENIQAYAGGRLEYDKMLRERGLVEIGYEKGPMDSTTEENYFANDAMIKAVIDMGIDLSGQEIDALKDGSMLSSTEIDIEHTQEDQSAQDLEKI